METRNRKFRIIYAYISSITLIAFLGCSKEFLEKKQNSFISTPSTLDDFQKLLDVEAYMRETPMFGEVSSDDYYITANTYKSLYYPEEKNAYTWERNIYEGTPPILDWNTPYQQVFYANVVLEGLESTPRTESNRTEWNNIKGSALFIRSYAFFNLAQIYCDAYDESSSNEALGVPLRLTSNINQPTRRPTIQQTYDQITNDLILAKDLLSPEFPKTNRNRPSKPAAFALLARAYLSMRKYQRAGEYADSALLLYSTLMNYNKLSISDPYPINIYNEETIYQSTILTTSEIILGLRYINGYYVDSTLYKSYDDNDLRKLIFFTSDPRAKASYADRTRFSGLATDELFLIQAEALARMGNKDDAMKVLNNLLRTRWKIENGQSTFKDYNAVDKDDALKKVLAERRKELVFRGLRWSDIRRLNKEGANIILKRVIEGTSYVLSPNDPKYIAPIPNDVLSFTGIEQNIR